MTTIHTRRSAATAVETPIDHATIAQMRLGDARIVLAGTLAMDDYRKLLDIRADAIASAEALRHAAAGGLFAFEYNSGSRQARRAAQLLGRVNVLYANMSDGEPTAADWKRFHRASATLLKRAQANLDQAYIAAYTGTHY
jgi:hypothetical protein